MGHKKESGQDRADVRVCPKCAKAFFTLDDECATCCFCETPVNES